MGRLFSIVYPAKQASFKALSSAIRFKRLLFSFGTLPFPLLFATQPTEKPPEKTVRSSKSSPLFSTD
jgi:hypothetical protein